MTWWQTLLVGTTPAVVTAMALLGQQTLTTRAARTLHVLQSGDARAADRRGEVLAAHRDALARLSTMEDALRAQAFDIIADLRSGTHTAPDEVKVTRTARREAEDAVSEVALLCGEESSDACKDYNVALIEFGKAFLGDNAAPGGIEAASRDVYAAREAYVAAARSDLATTNARHAAPPARSRR